MNNRRIPTSRESAYVICVFDFEIHSRSPFELVLEEIRTAVDLKIAYIQAHVDFVVVVLELVVLLVTAIRMARGLVHTHPELATLLGLHVIYLVGLFVGDVFVLGVLSNPEHAFTVITDIWNDPRFWVQLDFSDQLALLFTGVLFAFGGLFVYELGKLAEITHVYARLEAFSTRFRR